MLLFALAAAVLLPAEVLSVAPLAGGDFVFSFVRSWCFSFSFSFALDEPRVKEALVVLEMLGVLELLEVVEAVEAVELLEVLEVLEVEEVEEVLALLERPVGVWVVDLALERELEEERGFEETGIGG